MGKKKEVPERPPLTEEEQRELARKIGLDNMRRKVDMTCEPFYRIKDQQNLLRGLQRVSATGPFRVSYYSTLGLLSIAEGNPFILIIGITGALTAGNIATIIDTKLGQRLAKLRSRETGTIDWLNRSEKPGMQHLARRLEEAATSN